MQLKEGFDWLPSYLSLADEDASKKIPLQVGGTYIWYIYCIIMYVYGVFYSKKTLLQVGGIYI